MVSTSTDFSVDAPNWGLDDTSQNLLNEAIASNYRSRDFDNSLSKLSGPKASTSKRKPSKKGLILKDGTLFCSTDTSSATMSSSGEKRGYDKTEGASKNAVAPKRAGRKPLDKSLLPEAPLDPKQKRKEQNRAAQRAFRERKERHVSELQERIRELEEENASHSHLLEENIMLKDQVKQLQEENYALRGTAFTFEYPAKPLPHDEEYRSPNSSSSNSSCGSLSTSGNADKMSSSSNSSVKSGESPAIASAGDSPEEENQSTPQDQQLTIAPFHNPLLTTTDDLLMRGDDSHNFNFFNPAPFVDVSHATLSSGMTKLPGQQQYPPEVIPPTTATIEPRHSDLTFTDYRVPPSADGFLFQNESELPPLFGEELDLFGFTAPMPSTNNNFDSGMLDNQQQQQDLLAQLADPNFLLHTTQDEQTQTLLQQLQQQGQLQQGNVNHEQVDHANALELLMESLHQARREPRKAKEIQNEVKAYCPDFDLDDLCSDLKKKATCSESVFTPKEVNEIIGYFQNKEECKLSNLKHRQQQVQQQH
ncbi:hypothetical protein BX666DRAFT_2031802 [Dichotomocladium elegans]|nr:hypothetical protein BX666DRAFT_2031802 [Dichotomocladium elegans]